MRRISEGRMWAFLLDPGVQAVGAFGAVCALGTVVYDLYEGSSGGSAAQPRSPRGAFKSGFVAPEASRPRRDAKYEPCVEFFETGGLLNGRVRRGPCRGLDLDMLTPAQAQAQLAYARLHDPETALRLEAYGRRAEPPPARESGEMSRAQALAELGLRDGASEAEIHTAYRQLIKRHHPDHGGSHAKAARINQAKAALE